MNAGVPTPSNLAPVNKPPLMNPDVIMALALGTVSLLLSTFTTDPHVTLVLQLLSGELTLVAGVLHLDGK